MCLQDRVNDRQRDIMWELPIQLDVSTSSYVDSQKRQAHDRDHCNGAWMIDAGDMLTVMRNNYYR